MWSRLPVLALTLAACKPVEADITLTFATEDARAQTRRVAYTAFEPILAQPDTEDQIPRFVRCDEVGVFGPTSIVNPDDVSVVPNLAGVISERTTQNFPLDGDWTVDLNTTGFNPELNPWGAIMVYVEARGDARAPESQGSGQVSATLLSGCFCIRTKDGSFPDLRLDNEVKQACRAIEGEGAVTAQQVNLEPVISDAFRIASCEGVTQLTAPRNELLSPGPTVCVETTRCDALTIPGPCFDCEQPCSELDDRSRVPVQFQVFRDDEETPSETQVVLTDVVSRAQALLEVGDCQGPIRVEAKVVGRTNEQVNFDVDCVEQTIEGFDCPNEIALDDGIEPQAIARVIGDPQACANGDIRACDRIAILSDDGGDQAILEVRNVDDGTPLTRLVFANEKAHAVAGYFYRLAAPGQPANRPLLAVATSEGRDRTVRLRIFDWDYRSNQLVPHDNATGIIEAPCDQWICGSLDACAANNMCGIATETCAAGVCQKTGDRSDACELAGPVFCECELVIQSNDRVTLRARDIDRDGLADLFIGSSGQLNLHVLYSSRRPQNGNAAYGDNCTCGQFTVAPNAFGVASLAGTSANPAETDLILGSQGGMFVRYAERVSSEIPGELRCGQPTSIGDSAPVRDVQVAALRCPLGDFSCAAYDDVISVSAVSVAGGTLNDPGAVRVLEGGPDLLPRMRLPQGTQRKLIPRSFEGRSRPEDPQRARIADFNGDGNLDLAVLYKGTSQEIHVWLGASNGGFGEISGGVVLEECANSFEPDCPPLSDLVALDSDGDGRNELAVVCSPSRGARLRLFAPR